MSDFNMMNRKITQLMDNSIKRFCSPLISKFDITHFYHMMLTNSGEFAAGGLNHDWHECFYSGNELYHILPYFHLIKSSPGKIIFTQTIENEYWKKLLNTATKKFNVHLGLHISFQTNEGQEAFGFGLKTADPFKHMSLLNELHLIHIFIKEFRNKFGNSYLKNNLIDVATPVGRSFYDIPRLKSASKSLLHCKTITTQNPFTKRETDVIPHLLNGLSASCIAEKLSKSKRTVEHHLERMKEKFDCTTKSELIQKCRQLESFGLL